jgi:hypothetical protein
MEKLSPLLVLIRSNQMRTRLRLVGVFRVGAGKKPMREKGELDLWLRSIKIFSMQSIRTPMTLLKMAAFRHRAQWTSHLAPRWNIPKSQ